MYIHLHTHTHIYMCVCLCMSVSVCVYLYFGPQTWGSSCRNGFCWRFIFVCFLAEDLLNPTVQLCDPSICYSFCGDIYTSIIIVILSYHQHRYPWPSLATPPSCSSPLAGSQGYIPYPHCAAVCRFELVALLLLGQVKGSIGVHHLWARPYFSGSVLHVWFV